MYRRIFKAPQSESFFLLGPRGVGKSAFLKTTFPGALYIDLLLSDLYRTYSARPERLKDLIDGEKPNQVIIDEIQKVPELLSTVHHLIEAYPHIQFILSGSSARKLRMKGGDLLASRALLFHLYPFVPQEVGEDFNLEQTLIYGLIPIVFNSREKEAKLESYIGLYLKEEIKQEGLVKDLSSFTRFLETVSFSQASQINIANISRDSEVERKSVERYLEVLEDTLLATRVQVFDKKPKRKLVHHPKFYFFDCGLFYHLRPKGLLEGDESSRPILDQAFESLVFQYLTAHLRYQNPFKSAGEIFYWRTLAGLEVDFVVYGSKRFQAFEVKNSKKIKPEHLKGLKAFAEDYPQAELFLIYRGSEALKIDGINIVPAESFFKYLPFEQN